MEEPTVWRRTDADRSGAGNPPPTPARRLASGMRLGPYEIVSLVGVGGMGAVYKGRDTRLGRPVALKLLTPHVRAGRFLEEARAVSALNHPNIVTLYDLGSDAGLDFLVFEFVAGRTLAELVQRGPLAPADLIEFGVQIAEALAAAHEAGFVHRDIKPSNIVVTPQSRIKILDFGIAKLVEQFNVRAAAEATTMAGNATEPGLVVGTILYMSPEQTRGEPLDGRSDIFSLGSVLYEAATGHPPFRGGSALAIMHEIATIDPPPPGALGAVVPPGFDDVVARALAKKKGERFASAAELAGALRALRAGTDAVTLVPKGAGRERFVGRSRELAILQEAARQATSGAGTTVFITGEPGLGKSALASTFLGAAAHGHPQPVVARGACIEQYGAGEAYLPFLDALGGLLTGPGCERVKAVLRLHAPTWCLQFPGVFGATGTLEQLQQEAIGATKERMLREFGDAVAALTATQPLFLLLEDLHWSDPASVDLLRHLGGRAGRQRVLVIGTLRGADAERIGHPITNAAREMRAHGLCKDVGLEALGAEDVARYLDARFQPDELPPTLAPLIYGRTEGHPLFTTALVDLLVERGDISRTDGRWRLTRALADETLAVPESVRGMILKKLDGLSDDERGALQQASVQGEEFLSTVLAQGLEADELALEQQLDRIQRVHHLIEKRSEEELPDGSLAVKYRFVHALYQNILYESILTKRRVVLHLRVGESLVRRHAGQTARIAGALATHFERGRDYGRAIEYLQEAVDVALDRYAGAAAEEHCSRALELAERLPAGDRARTRMTLMRRRGTIRLDLGKLRDAKEDLEEVIEQARALNDLPAEGAALNALANPFLSRYMARPEAEMQRAQRALAVAEAVGDAALRAEAMVNLALRQAVLGDPAGARALFEDAVSVARSTNRPAVLLRTLTYRGIGHFFQTEFQDAERMLREAVALASRLHDGGLLRTALFFHGWTLASLGRISEAFAALDHVREMATRNADTLFLARVPRRTAWIRHELGDSGPQAPAHRGEEGAEPRDPEPELMAPVFSGVRVQAKTAQDALRDGDFERAAEEAQRLLENSLRHGPPKYVALAYEVLADVGAARGDVAAAERQLMSALDALAHHPAPLVQWRTWAKLGRVRRARKDRAGAHTAFAQAAEIVRAIASTIDDERLRTTFLTSPAVEEVIREGT